MKKIFLLALGCMMAAGMWAVDVTTLNYDGEGSIPSGYTLSSTNPPAIGTAASGMSTGGSYINVSNGGASDYAEGSKLPTKRFMTFDLDENCTVTINFYSGSTGRKLCLVDGTTKALLASKAIDTKNVLHTLEYTFSDITASKTFYLCGLSSSNCFITKITFAKAGPSSEAALSALSVTGATLEPAFDAATLKYACELPAGTTSNPEIKYTTKDSKAKAEIANPTTSGTTTITVTAEDGTTKKVYEIFFSVASANPVVMDCQMKTADNKTVGVASINGDNITVTVPYSTDFSALTPVFTGKRIGTVSPEGAQSFTEDTPKDFIITTDVAGSGATSTYHVTVHRADPLSENAYLSGIKINGTAVSGFNKTKFAYEADWATGQPQPTVTYTQEDSKSTVTPTVGTGVVTLLVTAEDGLTTNTYTITFNKVVPKTDLETHVPDFYELDKDEGGYGTQLTVIGGREYEVFYSGRNVESNATIQTRPGDKTPGITKNETTTSCRAKDDWFNMSIGSIKGTETAAMEEFSVGSGRTFVVNGTSQYIEMHVKGFDQFSLLGYDKKCSDPNKPDQWQILTVSIDGEIQPMTPAHQTWTVRRFDISTGEHVIRISGSGSGDNQVGGWSLRCGTDPRVRYIMGNDSTQSIFQTKRLSPITYFVKNNIDTRVEWLSGTPANGINLVKLGSFGVGDTLQLAGNANCPVGTYQYQIVAYNKDGVEKSRSEIGSFSVKTQISAKTDTVVEGYEGWSMDAIEFNYLALDASGILLTWTGGTPAGISGSGTDGVYSISGIPSAQGVYPFTISIDGGNTLTGKLTVKHLELGANPLLYLYKSDYEADGIYKYLESDGYSIMLSKQTALKQMIEGGQINKFKVVVISENVDANQPDVMNLIEQSTIPVLNMQAFAYSKSRLNWGSPANGSAVTAKMKVIQPTHPIFKSMNLTAGQEIELLDSVETRGLVAAEVTYQGSWCLSTTAVRGVEYQSDGEQQTFLHEVSAADRGSKYLCLPIAKASSKHLTTQGKRLIKECISYLMDGTKSPIALPTLKITSFTVNGVAGVIDEENKTITITMSQIGDYSAVTPVVTLADPTTFVTPASGATINLSDPYIGVDYVVCDYINKAEYKVYLKCPSGLEDILYTPGEWVNIYDMRGNKLTMTNENVHTMSLPKGIYIIQTSTHAFRIFR